VSGFPNLFTVTGPGSPSVLSNMVVSIEQHVEWIAACLGRMKDQGSKTIEPTLEAQEQWVTHVNEVANMTLFPRGNTWYMGANVPGKPRTFLPYLGVGNYRALCDEVAKADYKGFTFA
jgi:cyclohexanone monooxygenase